MNNLPYTARSYAAAREALLARLRAGLQADPRIVAAWLMGSYGRGEQDFVSDVDLAIVVDQPFACALCARRTITGAFPPVERMDLFRRFGVPANIHENHNNAPVGGSFSSVLYADPPVLVDWTILPRALAVRARKTLLLFDRIGIPRLAADRFEIPPGQCGSPSLNERIAFFWMMAAVTAKYIVRGRTKEVEEFLSFSEEILHEIERLLSHPLLGTSLRSYAKQEAQSARLRQLCDRVESLAYADAQVGERLLPPPRWQVEAILGIPLPQDA